MNSNGNSSEVARQKIIPHHFSGADASIEVRGFASMDTKLLPQAIQWIGRDELGFSLMHQFIRDIPSLFEIKTKPKANATTVAQARKRKLQTDSALHDGN